MGFIETADGSSYVGDDVDANGNPITDFEAGVIEQLAVGEKFIGFDPRYPHEQFDTFVKTCLQTISGSVGPGVAYSALSGNLENVNYSSIRSGVLEEREAWKAVQSFFISVYVRPVYEQWLAAAMTTSKLTVGGRPLRDTDIGRYRRVAFQPRRWAWVDPRADMAASIEAINNNITTVSATIRELGHDPDEVFEERAKEKERLAYLKLTPAETLGVVANV